MHSTSKGKVMWNSFKLLLVNFIEIFPSNYEDRYIYSFCSLWDHSRFFFVLACYTGKQILRLKSWDCSGCSIKHKLFTMDFVSSIPLMKMKTTNVPWMHMQLIKRNFYMKRAVKENHHFTSAYTLYAYVCVSNDYLCRQVVGQRTRAF